MLNPDHQSFGCYTLRKDETIISSLKAVIACGLILRTVVRSLRGFVAGIFKNDAIQETWPGASENGLGPFFCTHPAWLQCTCVRFCKSLQGRGNCPSSRNWYKTAYPSTWKNASSQNSIQRFSKAFVPDSIFDRDTPAMLCSWGTATLARRKTRVVLNTFYQSLNLVIDIDIASSGK
jgi:hypothetical protein